MKTLIKYLLSILISALFFNAVLFASSSFNFPGSSQIEIFEVKAEDGVIYNHISLEGIFNDGQPGEPELPVEYVNLIIPSDQTAVNIRVISSTEKEYILEKLLFPAQHDRPTTDREITIPFVPPKSEIYQSADPYPENIVNIIKHNWFDGDKHIVTLAISPVHYFPKENKIILHTDVQYEIEYSSGAKGAIHIESRSAKQNDFYNELLKNIVSNPDDIPVTAASGGLSKISSGPLPFYEYVIITPIAFENSFNMLLDWKKRKGLDAGVVTVEDILSNYTTDHISGITDDAGAIRQYLYDAYTDGTTVFALMGGDYNGGNYNYVPIRYGCGSNNTWTSFGISGANKIPADLYFCDFNGDWDVDGADPHDLIYRYGEESDDNPDYGPEIFVGRLLCTSETDILNWTDKIILYEQNPGKGDISYLTSSFMVVADEMECDYNPNQAVRVSNHLPSSFLHLIWEETPSGDDPNPTFPFGYEVINEMNNHHGLYSWFGHGSPRTLNTKTANLNKSPRSGVKAFESMDAEMGNGLDCMTNFDYPSILYSIGCDNTPFDDYDTHEGHRNIGEAFTVYTNAGGPALLGNTRFGWIGSSYELYKKFADLLTAGGANLHLGVAEAVSRQNNIYKKHYLSYSHNLVGCPETKMWVQTPSSFASVSVTDGGSYLTVNAGLSNCDISVCSIDNGQSYHLVASGVSSYTFTTSIRPLYVTISKENYLPFVGITGGSITENHTLYGKLEILDDLSITNSKTLTVGSGSEITMRPDVSINVASGSKIAAIGTESNPISFRRSGSSAWDRIQLNGGNNEFEWCVFDGGTYNVDIRSRYNDFSHCTFKNASRGVNAYKRSDNSWSSFALDNCMLDNNQHGVVAFYTYGAINSCTSQNNTSYGVGLYNARIGNNYAGLSGFFTDNLIQDNDGLGICLQHNGKLWLGHSSTPGYNKVIDNGSHEISIYSSTSARLYEASNGGFGTIYDNSGYYIYNLGKTWQNEQYVLVEVSAEYNYWGSFNGPSSGDFYGPVDYDPYLEYDITINPGASGYPARVNPGPSEGEPIHPEKNILSSVLSVTGTPESTGGSDDLSAKLQALENDIKSDPNNPNNAGKLNEMYNLQVDDDPDDKLGSKDNTMSMLAGYRDALMEMDEKSVTANPDSAAAVKINGETAMVLEMYDSSNLSNYKQTLELASKYDSYIKNSDSRREFLSLKLSAYEYTNQYEQALKVLEELKKEVECDYKYYTAPSYEVIEQNLCEQLGKPYIAKTDASTANYEDEFLNSTPEKFALHNNYPNPFNPLTSIPFSLTKDSHVKLDVFNTLGQRVATLSDKSYQAGNHLIRFNAQGFSSGIYFVVAQIKTLDSPSSNYVFNRKMILLK